MPITKHKLHYVDNGAGWALELKQCDPPKHVVKKRRPVVIVPGYGMNSFIFGYHPQGLSMEDYFTKHGLEVWSLNLRNQGGSRWEGGSWEYSLKDLGAVDLKAALQFIANESRSEAGKVDVIGCSLGGTIAFIHAACVPRNHLGSIVAIGSPLRWEQVHPIMRLGFAIPAIAGLIPVNGAKDLLRVLKPFVINSPLLKLYLHKDIVDLSDSDTLLKTVEDPSRFINKEIAQWIRSKDLIFNGINLTEEFHKVTNPLLCVIANSDGIVPPMTAMSPLEVAASKVKDTLVVGTEEFHFAHADLFISNHSQKMVFKPIADWLLARY